MDEITALKEAEKQQVELAEPCRQSQWAFPVMLILLGGVFLLSNMGVLALTHWWALFLWWPAINKLEKAYYHWQSRGRVTRRVRRHLIGAAIWGFLGVVFLLGLNWGLIWPVLLIVWGLSALLKGLDQG